MIDTVERTLICGKRWLRSIAERLQGGAPVIVKGIDALDPAARLAVAGLWEMSVLKGPVMLTATLRSAAEAEETAVGLGALREADGNRSRAAEILGLSRAAIYHKMKAYKITDS
ncbi:helix-turn-helix domain-containing protein [Streptomyces sp. NPDC002513]